MQHLIELAMIISNWIYMFLLMVSYIAGAVSPDLRISGSCYRAPTGTGDR